MLKNLWRNARFLLITALLMLLFLFSLYRIMKNAETAANEYLQAMDCSTGTMCREIARGTLLEAEHVGYSALEYSGKGLPPRRVTFSRYAFSVMTEAHQEYEFTVIPGVPRGWQEFDVEKLYVPSRGNSGFLENNFFKGGIVEVEIWQDQVTLVYLSSIVENLPAGNPDQENSPATNETTLTSSVPKVYDIAIATVDHPLVIKEFARRDFYGWSVSISVIMLILFVPSHWKSNRNKRQND